MMEFIDLLRTLWAYSPTETAFVCGVTAGCSVLLALCIVGLVGG